MCFYHSYAYDVETSEKINEMNEFALPVIIQNLSDSVLRKVGIMKTLCWGKFVL